MKDHAQTWHEIQDFIDISEAKESFLNYFWSDEAQARVRENLYTGKYVVGSTVIDYPCRNMRKVYIARAKLLNPLISDHEMIRCIKRHFSMEIAREIRPGTVTSIFDLTRTLDDIEEKQKLYREKKIRKALEDKENALRVANRDFRREEIRQDQDRFFDRRPNFVQARPNFTQQNYRNNFPPNNIRPVYKNEQLREKDSKINNRQFQSQESKTKVNKVAAFATNNDSEVEDSYEEDT